MFDRFDVPNVPRVPGADRGVQDHAVRGAGPTRRRRSDIDFLLALGEIFTLVVYAQLFLENAEIYDIDRDLVDQVFDVFVRDFSRFAVQLHGKPSTTDEQMDFCLQMIRKPVVDAERFNRVWTEQVHSLRDAYEMRP